ncbi:MAG TPA: hypothetical protein VHO72_16330 [Bacteroidales bacterium]|nr:hypothetical protein [Bacteroidales bacterium]
MRTTNKPRTYLLTWLILGLLYSSTSYGQKFDNAGAYLEYMGKQYRKVMEDMWDYTSTSAHSRSARKIENRRKDLLSTTKKVQQSIAQMPDFEGDNNLRDSTVSYLKLSYDVLNYDYAKIVNMEEVAEQSYDLMEAYILAQEMANEKLNKAGVRLETEQQSFIKKHNIKIAAGKDKLDNKLEKANKAYNHYNRLYLIFFKSFKQDFYLAEALQKNDVNSSEQNRNSLLKYATEGLKKLDTIKGFGGDNSLKMSLKQVLDFYKQETSVKIPILINFYLKKETYEKTKSAFETKSEMERTKSDVDQYNKALADYNRGIAEYNRVITEISQKNNTLIDSWNKAGQSFLDRQVPKK